MPVVGSYSSAEARTLEDVSAVIAPSYEASMTDPEATGLSPVIPPVMSTRPSDRRVAVWNSRGLLIEPVGLKVPVAGSYSSADAQVPACVASAQL